MNKKDIDIRLFVSKFMVSNHSFDVFYENYIKGITEDTTAIVTNVDADDDLEELGEEGIESQSIPQNMRPENAVKKVVIGQPENSGDIEKKSADEVIDENENFILQSDL
jgi:hypothetical protein